MKGGRLAEAVEAFLIIAAVVVALAPIPAGTAYLTLMDPVHGLLGAHRLNALLHTNLIVEGVPGNATVYWGPHGVPYIYATSDEAGMYALGWVEAGLRLFQMDIYRRLAEGRLSQLIGPQALETDKLVVGIGLPNAVKESAQRMLKDPALAPMNRLIYYFLLGVNDYIRYINRQGLQPVEYRLLGLQPEPWNYTDVVAVTKTLALVYSFSDSDLVNNELVRRWGPGILGLLGIPERPLNPASATCNETIGWRPAPAVPLSPPATYERLPHAGDMLQWLNRAWSTTRLLAGGEPASTAVVVEPRFASRRMPLLAVDLHGSLTVPDMWLPVRLVTPSYNVAGIVVPGLPFLAAGRTADVAWGFIAARADQIDFYYFKWDGRGRYYYDGSWHSVERMAVEVRYWNPAKHRLEAVTITVNRTVVGPLIEWKGEAFAVRWVGLGAGEDLAFYWRAMGAGSVNDVLAAERYLTAPMLVVVAADTGGHVAVSPVGSLPVRGNLSVLELGNGSALVNTGFLPFNASKGEGEWVGFTNKIGLPILLDPNRPFVLVSGNRLWSGNCSAYPNSYFGYEFDDGYRFRRLYEILEHTTSRPRGVSASDLEAALNDWIDYGLLNLTRTLIVLASRNALELGARERSALNMLSGWDGSTRRGAGTPQAALATAWVILFYKAVWEKLGLNATDELHLEYLESLLASYIRGDKLAVKVLGRGYPEVLASQTLSKALDTLEKYYGTADMALWDYGMVHYYQPRHPLGWILNGLNLPKIPAPGGPQSPYTAAPVLNLDERTGAPVRLASSVRIVVDLSRPSLLLSIPGGVSGNPLSPHYQDLYQAWVRGSYIEISLEAPPSQEAILNITGTVRG